MEGKQFDEALVERLAREAYIGWFANCASTEANRQKYEKDAAEKWERRSKLEGSENADWVAGMQRVLAALSETHVIVGKAEYFKTLGMVEKACLNCGTSFWSRHGNQRYCPAGDRRTVWSRKRRAQAKEVSPRA